MASSVWPEKKERDTLGLTELLCQQRKNHHRPEFLAASILHQRVGVVVVDGLEKLPHLETDKRFKKEKKIIVNFKQKQTKTKKNAKTITLGLVKSNS